ncbi:MAG: hypothetical protein ABDH23_00805 [Endomicrobiia bacterium]
MLQDKDKKVDEILEELKNVLDSITKKTQTNTQPLQEDSFKKIEEMKNILKSKEKEEIKLEEKKEATPTEKVDNVNKLKTSLTIFSETTKEEKTEQKISSTAPEKPSTEVMPPEEADKKEGIVIKTMVLVPLALQDAKDEFFNNVNSTLKRVSKKNIEFKESICVSYSSLTKDIFLQYSLVVEKIRNNNINALIFIVNENTLEVEEFIKKISSFVILAKSITMKELKMRSTYLDLSIDLLLTIK